MKRRTFLKGGLAGAALFAVPRFVNADSPRAGHGGLYFQ